MIAAWCEDLASLDYRHTGRTPRADAVCGLDRHDAAEAAAGAASIDAVTERGIAAG